MPSSLLCTVAEKVSYLYNRFPAFEQSVAILESEESGKLFYRATANNTTARVAAVAKAMTYAKNRPDEDFVLTLGKGTYTLVNGFPWAYYLTKVDLTVATNVRIRLLPETEIIYSLPEDAQDDCLLYEGKIRYITNFGGRRDDYTYDNIPAIKTAMYTLPPFEGADPDHLGNIVRFGEVIVPQGLFRIDDTVSPTAYTEIRGEGRAILWAKAGFAPTTEKFMILNGRHDPFGSNFTHNVVIKNIILAGSATDNAGLSGAYIGSCQMSDIDLGITLMGKRGLVMHGGSNFTRINLDATYIGEGPALEVAGCNLVYLDRVSCVNVNVDGSELVDTFPMPAVYIHTNCASIRGGIVLAESCPHGMYIKSSRSVSIDTFEYYKGAGSGTGLGATIDSVSGIISIETIRTHSATIQVQNVGQENILGNPADYAYATFRTTLGVEEINFYGGTGAKGALFWRADSAVDVKGYRISGSFSTANPGLAFYPVDATGTPIVTFVDFAAYNGGNQAGYNISVRNLYNFGNMRMEGDFYIGANQILTDQQAAIADASGGATIDTEARAAINALLNACRTHGLIDT